MGFSSFVGNNLLLYVLFLFLTLLSSFSFSQPICHDFEKSSLLKFKESFIINKSVTNDPDAYSKVALWSNKEDCCMWDGVVCDEITGHVITLDLSNSYLYGSLDSNSTLFNLVHLQSLNLGNNHFNYSHIPNAINRLSMLTNLDLSGSVFSGQIPSEVSELSKLLQLSLCANIDPISQENLLKLKKPNFESLILNLTSLEELCLSYVSISSIVPKSLANLTTLKSLLLKDCELKGELPTNIFQLPNLQELSLRFNEDLNVRITPLLNQRSSLKSLFLSYTPLSGDLSSLNQNFSSLTELSASDCNISGVIPDSIGMLSQLLYLDLSENNLVGNIPSSVGNLTQLSELHLSVNQLSGPIPLSFSNLINLEILFVQGNSLSGIVDFDMFLGLNNLTCLDLSINQLSLNVNNRINNETFPQFTSLVLSNCNLTTFPHFLRHQRKLQLLYIEYNPIGDQIPNWMLSVSRETMVSLSLAGNSLIGELSSAICNQTSLQFLDLKDNSLRGELPPCLGNFSKSLSIVTLRNNHFCGNTPEFKGNQIRYIDLSINQFEGKIFKSLTNSEMLVYLNLEGNKLSDVFPYWLGNLPKLEVLKLQGNGFYGAIEEPRTILHFPKLRVIDISNNNFTGKLPLKYIQSWKSMTSTSNIDEDFDYMRSPTFSITTSYGTLGYQYFFELTTTIKGIGIWYSRVEKVLILINFSNNKFDGDIPQAIGNLKGLISLDLSNNRFKGGIPSSLSSLTNLESLDLSQNALSGEIPRELDKSSFLQYFNVSHNKLVGPIPQSHLITFDSSCYEGNLGTAKMWKSLQAIGTTTSII
ncbi:receptor-like protein 53 [Cannabis sativa]|nr:receptor-like protein 53 [Cannabis sativa]